MTILTILERPSSIIITILKVVITSSMAIILTVILAAYHPLSWIKLKNSEESFTI